ncbi:MAG: DNA mismatch repair endonuclease MutL [Deltaproteobacteria bacterium]|jgi:DNA mismatch repair protein MutL|nr:DNA mismatch repair endonuclease MutL [Deltaproteobacteria bacterium]
MPGRIRLLPDGLINRIAAGEVVERPGSILKELVENSLDSGADRIEVEAEEGGKRLVRVTDNGSGMDEEDLRMCLARHATSKLDPDSDLSGILTLGFRGEAIPAIASVSRLTITSCREGAEGKRAEVEGGRLLGVSPCPANRGTVVEVRDVFFNTPARRKFLKTVPTEEAHLVDACQRYALSRPDLALSLVADGREIMRVAPGESLVARLKSAAGPRAGGFREFGKACPGGLTVRGALAGPEHSARSGAALFVFVLGRPVRDRLLLRAVSQGYGRTLPQGRYPAGAVFIELDPADVDVNVHPAKTEVRFRSPGQVFSAVSRAVEEAVTAPPAPGAPPWRAPGESDGLPEAGWGASGFGEGSGDGRHAPARLPSRRSWSGPDLPPAGASGPPENPEARAAEGAQGRPASGAEGRQGSGAEELAGGRGEGEGGGLDDEEINGPGGPFQGESRQGLPGAAGERSAPGALVSGGFPTAQGQGGRGLFPGQGPAGLRPIAQLAMTYILAEAPDGLRIIDQHAAHERILFNRLKHRLEREGLPSQNVLLPDSFELHAHERAALERVEGALSALGFRLEHFGGNTWILKGIPKILTQEAAGEALREILSGARGSYAALDGAGADETVREVSEAWLHSVACRAAVKAGHDLTLDEMERLLQDMAAAEAGGFCPHGRPSSLSITYAELEKKFGRK